MIQANQLGPSTLDNPGALARITELTPLSGGTALMIAPRGGCWWQIACQSFESSDNAKMKEMIPVHLTVSEALTIIAVSATMKINNVTVPEEVKPYWDNFIASAKERILGWEDRIDGWTVKSGF